MYFELELYKPADVAVTTVRTSDLKGTGNNDKQASLQATRIDSRVLWPATQAQRQHMRRCQSWKRGELSTCMRAGVSDDTPLARLWAGARTLRIADGPDDVHLASIAKLELARRRARLYT